jgi:hypothetical protein
VIRDEQSLRDWVGRMCQGGNDATLTPEGHQLIRVDCEWHGRQYYDGKLRTIQFAWSESDAVAIGFRDERTNRSFRFQDTIRMVERAVLRRVQTRFPAGNLSKKELIYYLVLLENPGRIVGVCNTAVGAALTAARTTPTNQTDTSHDR